MLSDKEVADKYRLDELEAIISLVEESVEDAIKSQQIKEDCDEATYLIYACGKCLVTMREVIVLCRNGYPDGALALSRNIYEQMIITSYIESIEDKAERKRVLEKYNADYEVQRLRNHRFAHHLNENKKDEEEVDKEIHEILDKYGEKKDSEYWWTSGISRFSNMCKLVENDDNNADVKPLLITAHILYKRACLAIHASTIGNRIRLGGNHSGVDLGSWDKGQEYSLFLAVVSLIVIVGYTSYYLNFSEEDDTKINRTLNELAIHYDGIAKFNQKIADIQTQI